MSPSTLRAIRFGPESQLKSTSSCGALTGSVFSTTASSKLKMAVLAPIPSASVSTATVVNPGFLSNWRSANLRSFMTECLHRIDFCGPPRRQPASDERYREQPNRDGGDRQRIEWFYFEQQSLKQARERERASETENNSWDHQTHSLSDNKA